MTEIKKVGKDSLQRIAELAKSIWPSAYKEVISKEQIDYMLELMYSKKALNHQLENLQHQFIIAYKDGTPIGFAAYSPKIPEEKSLYRLHKLYISISLHGKGIGKKLIQYIIDDIKPNGATHLELNVNRNNKAIGFYSKLGFEITRSELLDIGNNFFMDDYIMTLSL